MILLLITHVNVVVHTQPFFEISIQKINWAKFQHKILKNKNIRVEKPKTLQVAITPAPSDKNNMN